jgi:type IV secretion system protein VirB10
MALAREVVAPHEPKPRSDLRKPMMMGLGLVSLALLFLYQASQQDETLARASEAPEVSQELATDRKTADTLVALAREQEEARQQAARRAATILGPSESAKAGADTAVEGLPRVRGERPPVYEVVGEAAQEGGAASAWAPAENDTSNAEPSPEDQSKVIVTQHRQNVLRRKLQASEEAMFADSMRVDGLEVKSFGTTKPQAARGAEEEGDEQYPMKGLNELSNALLQQSASQVRSGAAGGGGVNPMELLRGLSVPGLGSSNQAMPTDDGRAAKNLDFFQHGGDQLPPGYLVATVQKPLSPYELKMGTFIPGVLITAIHSESPGQILGQVSENIYDTAHQDHLLIPQGTKIVGTYSGAISVGQERVQVASVRLNFPNGDALDLGGMSVADASGQAGLHDVVNDHVWKRVGAALLSTAATVGYEVTAPQNPFGAETAVHRALGESIIKMANDMAARNAQIPPTLEIRAGGRFIINMNKDVVFPGPYEDGYAHRARDFRKPASHKRSIPAPGSW